MNLTLSAHEKKAEKKKKTLIGKETSNMKRKFHSYILSPLRTSAVRVKLKTLEYKQKQQKQQYSNYSIAP
jgi:hypothetical protein